MRVPALLRRPFACLAAGLVLAAGPTHSQTMSTGTLTTQATATYLDGARPVTLLSNIVTATVLAAPPTITFYTDSTYTHATQVASLGSTLYIGISAASCNLAQGSPDTMVLTLWSAKLQRKLTADAVETVANDGLYHFVVMTGPDTANWSSAMETAQGQVQSVPASTNDVLDAHVDGCGYGEASAHVLIDPNGVVFDSASNTPVSGATVSIVDVSGAGNGGLAGKAATVYQADGVTPAPSTVTTGSDGVYTFPLLAPSQYQLVVSTPAAYKYPSTVAPTSLPSTRRINLTGSFGGQFAINAATGALLIDVPVDEVPHGMSVTKTASRATAEIAESVGYTVVVRNVGGTALDSVALQDTLPTGFAYLPHSATIDGTAGAEPGGGRGPLLNFTVPAMAIGQTRTLRYRATIGPLALRGDGVNRVQARASLPFATVSNVAAATVQVQQGVFTDRAMVLGKVFADCNANGVQDVGEPGVPGVRLIMEDGSFVITDDKGQYSFYGVAPRTHVLKVDATTLPAGTTPMATSARHAGDGNSRFVDPHNGELARADFALSGCSRALDATIALRVNAGNELGSALKMDFRADGGAQVAGDVRALPAAGVIGEAQGGDGTRYVTVKAPGADGRTATISHAETAPQTLAQRIESLDDTLAFVDLRDGQTLPAAQATVRVKGSSRVLLALAVDGQDIGAERIGTRLQDDARQIQARDYVGVPLAPGVHVLTLTAKDSFGNVRGTVAVKVQAPGELARVTFDLPSAPVPADGRTMVPVKVDLSDANGVTVGARTAITLDSTIGDWDVEDLDPREPGIQTFVEGGHAEFHLRAPQIAGTAALRVATGRLSAKGQVSFVPALRPMLAAGIVEGSINLHRLTAGSVQSASANDGFEEELTSFATSGDKGANGRAALYLKGKVLGSSLLTLSYDSAKESSDGLFRDIQPDQFYPIYGDSSVKGYDAQSTSHLYVRLEHDKSYVLYGDFTTQANDPARQLGAYTRSLTGAKAHVEQGPVAATAFASKTTSQQVVDEIAANGTSGPFMLSSGQPLQNSETVEILVRDRNQPALIIRTTTLVRFTDYDIDPLTGRLLLHAPVPSVDPDLNPESIRVTYEADTGGPSFLVAGVDAKVKLGDKVEVGIALVMDKDPLDTMQMGSVNATFRPDEHTAITVEGARTAHEIEGKGAAQRVEFKHDDDKLKIQAQAVHTDANFLNPSATIDKGRNEADVKASYAVGDKTRVVVEAVHTGDVTTGDRRDGVLAGVERSLDGGAKVELGMRKVHDDPGSDTAAAEDVASTDTTTVRAKISAPIPGVQKATGFVEAEQDIHTAHKRLLAVGGDYRLTASSRVYVRQEVISSLTGPIALDPSQRRNTTLVGIDSDVTHDTHLFSEYRIRDAIDGREAEAALGLRNQYAIAEGVRLNTSFERVHSLSGGDADSNIAATAAIEYTRDPLTKASGRLELRDGSGSRGALSTLGLAHKIDEDWTLLARNAYAITESTTGGTTQLQERFQAGVAYRDSTTSRVNGLARYEFKREDNGPDFERSAVHIVSSHADLQVSRAMMVTGEYAAKHEVQLVDGRWIAGNAQLIGARLTRDLGERWDFGLAARVLANLSFSGRQTNFGGELGYRVIENLWLSLGYNLTGFHDRDLAEDNTTAVGAYLRVRFKFDETLFAGKSKAAP